MGISPCRLSGPAVPGFAQPVAGEVWPLLLEKDSQWMPQIHKLGLVGRIETIKWGATRYKP